MICKINGLFPPSFSNFITVYSRRKDGSFRVRQINGCKFTTEKTEFSGDIRGSKISEFNARIPIDKCEVAPGDILVKGAVFAAANKGEEGEDILKKYPHASFRARTVSFCGNHINVKG